MQITEVTQSITLERVVPFFQPIMDLNHNAVWRYECLARLVNEQAQTFAPSEFLYLIERNNQIEQLAETMFRQSAHYFRNINIAWNINICAGDLANPQLHCLFSNLLEEYPRPQRVALELTANAAIQHLDQFEVFIQQCADLGMSVFIDQCELPLAQASTLLKLPIKGIKLSGNLTKSLETQSQSRDYVSQLLSEAGNNKVVLIAEHVERPSTLAVLKNLGVRYAQGYYFSRPAAWTEAN